MLAFQVSSASTKEIGRQIRRGERVDQEGKKCSVQTKGNSLPFYLFGSKPFRSQVEPQTRPRGVALMLKQARILQSRISSLLNPVGNHQLCWEECLLSSHSTD